MSHRFPFLLLCPLMLVAACAAPATEDDDEDDPSDGADEASGLALLGAGSNSVDRVSLDVAYDSSLGNPRDLAFHPDNEWQLWVACADDDGVVVIDGLDDGDVDGDRRSGANSVHFLANPTALAFGDAGTMVTAHDEDEVTQTGTPANFMGPTLWPSDPDRFEGGHSSHLDMLHNSPNSVGAAAAGGNDYWIYDGAHGALALYKFNGDHGEGGSDHSDGELYRYLDGELGYAEDTASHIVLDDVTGLLYAADTENNQIVVLDTDSGEEGSRISPNYDGGRQRQMDDADAWVLIEGADFDLEAPSGVELHEDLLWVSDNETGRIAAFTLDGELVDWLDTELDSGALMGMAFAPDGSLFLTDAKDEAVLRLSVLEQ